jgi:prepilin-type N-terminal cleavage/methylation domain-containing protein
MTGTRNARAQRRSGGVTLIELMIVLSVLTVLVGLALPNFADFRRNQQVKGTARELADMLLLARTEAIRTGNNHVVFFGNPGETDPSGNAVERGGQWVPVLVIDDGAPATANCEIEAGEDVEAIVPNDDNDQVTWGVTEATSPVATDGGSAPFDPAPPPTWDGTTFADAGGNKINWELFRPDGIPVSFVGAMNACGAIAGTGSGGGAFYITNGERDYSVVLSPLGAVRVHIWNGGAWTS